MCKITNFQQHGKIIFCQSVYFRTFAIVNNNDMETVTAYTNATETTRTPRTRCTAKAAASKQTEVPKTPESELMSVDEYFGILHRMVDKYQDSIQG